MTYLPAAALLGAALALSPGTAVEHRASIDHPTGRVEAHYRGTLDVAHRQVGAVVPGGRPSTLRCAWDANLSLERVAHHPRGGSLSRSIRDERVATGSRPGWCSAQRSAIVAEAHRAAGNLDAHVARLAAADRAELHAEIDRLHGTAATG